jgi:DNA-binding response OmpR family regulator
METIKVLMVDDEEQFRETIAKILTRKGYEVVMAGSGDEAVQILKKKSQDVVILDIRMPGMDGHETLSEIKEISPETQVIMLTGHGGESSARASLKLGAYDYLSKPCDIDLLAAKINSAYAAIVHKTEKPEKRARDIMIPVGDYTTITEDKTVKEAIELLMKSFEGLIASNRVMETGHRSILVFDKNNKLTGILSIQDLIKAVRPAYLYAPKPSTADSIQYSPMFWSGLFTTQMKSLAHQKVGDVMSESPPSADEATNLMELANLMFTQGIRRLAVTSQGKVVGVVREQELFFEMADILL